jgi:hypothetical protein
MMAQIEGYDSNDEKKIKVFFIRKWGVSMIFFFNFYICKMVWLNNFLLQRDLIQ